MCQAFTVVIHRNAGVAPWHAGENLQFQLGQGDIGSEQGVFLGERVFLAHIDQRQFFVGQQGLANVLVGTGATVLMGQGSLWTGPRCWAEGCWNSRK